MPYREDVEEWRPVAGYEGYYDVSNFGSVRRVEGGKGATPGKVLKPWATPAGYYYASLCRGGVHDKHRVHRLLDCLLGERNTGIPS